MEELVGSSNRFGFLQILSPGPLFSFTVSTFSKQYKSEYFFMRCISEDFVIRLKLNYRQRRIMDIIKY